MNQIERIKNLERKIKQLKCDIYKILNGDQVTIMEYKFHISSQESLEKYLIATHKPARNGEQDYQDIIFKTLNDIKKDVSFGIVVTDVTPELLK